MSGPGGGGSGFEPSNTSTSHLTASGGIEIRGAATDRNLIVTGSVYIQASGSAADGNHPYALHVSGGAGLLVEEIGQRIPRDEKDAKGAKGRGEDDQDSRHHGADHEPRRQRQPHRARNRQRHNQRINEDEINGRQDLVMLIPTKRRLAVVPQHLEAEIVVQPEDEDGSKGGGDQ